MKKIFNAALLVMVAMAFVVLPTSCRKEEKKPVLTVDPNTSISKAVKGLNLPEEINDNLTLTECTYDNKVLTFRCTVDEETFKQLDKDRSRDLTLNQLKNGLFQEALVEKLKEADASVLYIMECGNDTVHFEYSAQDLQ